MNVVKKIVTTISDAKLRAAMELRKGVLHVIGVTEEMNDVVAEVMFSAEGGQGKRDIRLR